MKGSLRGVRFHSTEKLKQASEKYLKGLLKKDFGEVLQDWKRRMKNCVEAGESFLEGDKVFQVYENKKRLLTFSHFML